MFKFKDTLVNNYPFPHAITKNAIEGKTLGNLIDEFPDYEEVKHYENVMGGRRRVSSDNALFYKFINKSPSWKSFYESINSKKFVDEFFDVYKEELKEAGCIIDKFTFDSDFSYRKALSKTDVIKSTFRHKGWYSLFLRIVFKLRISRFFKKIFYYIPLELTQRYRASKLHIHMDISFAGDGYSNEIHHDSESRIAILLIFFYDREEVGGTGGDFCIYEENPTLGGKYVMFPSKKDVGLYLAVPPTKNLMFSFLSTPNSYHSVPIMKNSKEPRRFIYVGITANKTNLWKK